MSQRSNEVQRKRKAMSYDRLRELVKKARMQ